MVRKSAVGFLIATVVLSAGCKAPLLRELDADIPSAIVKQYEQSEKAYVDRGHFWAPCITALGVRVSKTEEGYHGTGNFDLGPLGVLVLGRQSSDYDEQGRLFRYSVRATTLWGILLADASCKEYDGAKGKWDEQWSRKIFFGLLGYEGDSDHWRAAYFLFIPIVTSHGSKGRPDHERGQWFERERRNEGEEGQEQEPGGRMNERDQGQPHEQENRMAEPPPHPHT